ncbi:hypothetical protein SNEBB_002057 [Seison nebaliae]|nr:hypothetical protein SNEBB_002057 [Seison nebaliae]
MNGSNDSGDKTRIMPVPFARTKLEDTNLINDEENPIAKEIHTEETVEPQLSEQEIETLKNDLNRIQDEIGTLRHVLQVKVREESEIKAKLGITALDEIQAQMQDQFKTLQSSVAYQKTAEGLKTATDKITPAFQTLGKKIGTLGNSSVMKNFGSTFTNVKQKVSGSKSLMNFQEFNNDHLDDVEQIDKEFEEMPRKN